jgi:hypothetical protein
MGVSINGHSPIAGWYISWKPTYDMNLRLKCHCCRLHTRFCQSQICQAARPASSWPAGTTGKLVDVADWIMKPNKIVVVYHWAIGFTVVLSAFVRFYELLSIGTSDRTVQCLVSTHTSPQSRAVLTSRLALTCLNSGFESIRCRASAIAKHWLLFAVLTSAGSASLQQRAQQAKSLRCVIFESS